ncbi:MAG TPA: glycine--tRNA ligase [Ignavibacteriales bacterium]|nr:glycine--tRNA ligase [Ignavibacteriales bacterium]
MKNKKNTLGEVEKIVSLAKRRGFVFQSSEIYGGLNGCWDYGPLGVELLRNIKEVWWKAMTYREDVEGLDASILMHSRVWEASGHVENFTDPMVDCKQCKARFRLDVLSDSINEKKKDKAIADLKNDFKDNTVILEKIEGKLKNPEDDDSFNLLLEDVDVGKTLLFKLNCPQCGNANTFTDARKFNLMFKTFVGPVEDTGSVVYLRPETAQGIFVNFLNVQGSSRQKIPFGIAQVGKAFRNEINTKNFLFRTREFEQMEMQFFIKPGTEMQWFEYWKTARLKWHYALGTPENKYRLHLHEKLAHYANAAVDIEFEYPFGFKELEGIHSRTNFDLSQHEKFSGKKLQYFDPESNESYVPYVIETSIGLDRMFLAVLSFAYNEEKLEDGSERIVLRIPPVLAPIKIAVLPLVKRDNMPEKAYEIMNVLKFDFMCQYDEKDTIGRRYRRQDAIGTPYCITIDQQTFEDNTVTIRERDTMKQVRVLISKISEIVNEKLNLKNILNLNK